MTSVLVIDDEAAILRQVLRDVVTAAAHRHGELHAENDKLHLPIQRRRGAEARLPAWGSSMLVGPGAGSFGLTLWSTLLMTRRLAAIGGSRF